MTRNGTISTLSPVMRRIMAALDRDGDMDDGHNQPPPMPRSQQPAGGARGAQQQRPASSGSAGAES